MTSKGGKDFELIFEGLFEQTLDDEVGNPFLRFEFFWDILVIAQLPIYEHFGEELVPGEPVSRIEVEFGWFFAVLAT
ncbi:hypothetical protein [uncultured Fibrobacter sp.]|uniref:hypothetical protein n=1 Tax=uncultured Fibrobacter sp. TaxID=261512 RepID=UPI00262FC15D|nr:hypothetical protein [uncultured Fibrobacter sp.]